MLPYFEIKSITYTALTELFLIPVNGKATWGVNADDTRGVNLV